MTPMLRQYFDLKQQAQGAILFFRMGDFYEIFGDDAAEIAPKLQIVLTSREKGDAERLPFCGVPHHSVKTYWMRLLRLGYKVAIADQVEDPAIAKGLVRREITRFLTPACIDELDSLDADQPNYLVALLEDPKQHTWSILAADVSTGELRAGEAADLENAVRCVARLHPKEILAREFQHTKIANALAQVSSEKISLVAMPEAILRDGSKQTQHLKATIGKPLQSMDGVNNLISANTLIAAVLEYLQQIHYSPERFLAVKPLLLSDRIALDAVVCRDLELFETAMRREAEGSLLREINRTATPMGARTLRYDLAHPFATAERIKMRNIATGCLRADTTLLQNIRNLLANVGDLERLSTRLIAGSISPGELAVVRGSLRAIRDLNQQLTGKTTDKLSKTFGLQATTKQTTDILRMLDAALADSPGRLGSGNEVFRQGFDKILDDKNALAHAGETRMLAYEESLRQQTGISSLKVKNHKSFGLLIEVTKTHSAKIPAQFIRKQTMVNGERFTTPELQALDAELSQAQGRATEREAQLFSDLVVNAGQHRAALLAAASVVAELDIVQSFAFKSLQSNYCQPDIASDGTLELKSCRHPVVESFVGGHAYTANDITIRGDAKRILLTGPNMAGKSTVMRQIAIASILHQIGSFVPAKQARLPLFDQFFTRVGASDDLARGQSTFMVEMSEAAHILRHATSKSLVILDEVGRGTSTQDGVAIAAAILEDLSHRVDCYALFATHYHELVPLAQELPGVLLMQTEVREDTGRVVFTHRLIPGASGSSFGIEVAKLAGLPDATLRRANHLLMHGLGEPPKPSSERATSGGELPRNWQQLIDIAARLESVRIHKTTPLQALNMLNDMKSALENPAASELFLEQ